MKSRQRSDRRKQRFSEDSQLAAFKPPVTTSISTALSLETTKLATRGQTPIKQFVLFEDTHYDLGGEDGKQCSKCNQLLPLSAYSFTSGGNYLRPECRQCNNELSKVRQALRDRYGMPTDDKYVCPICIKDAEAVKGTGNTKNGSWVVDHCHTTEEFRGWLCHKCNRALGGFDDSVDTLERAITYLKGNNNENSE